MASLMEELLDVMSQEASKYQELYDLTDDQKQSIIQGRIQDLQAITDKEQEIGDTIKQCEDKRVSILKDMAVVLGHDGEEMTVTKLADLMNNQPDQKKALLDSRDRLVDIASKLSFANQQNQVLLKQAMELVEFDLTLIKSMKQAPETGNYDKNAYNTGDLLSSSGFDAKQ